MLVDRLTVPSATRTLENFTRSQLRKEYPLHTTGLSQSASEWVTITHPHHPLYRQQVEILKLRRGSDPDLIVRLPDQSHAAVAMSWTDYAGGVESPPSQPPSLLSLSGLREIVALLDNAPRK